MINRGKVIKAMIDYYGTNLRRINHFLKVFSFAKKCLTSRIKNDILMVLYD